MKDEKFYEEAKWYSEEPGFFPKELTEKESM